MATSNQNPGPPVTVQVTSHSPNIVLRFIWFLFIGWWLSGVAIAWAWLFNVLIITLPLGMYILNRLPQIATLRPPNRSWQSSIEGGVTVLREVDIKQRPFLIRAVFFILLGWWISMIWLVIAWLAQLTLILIPLSFFMYSKSAAMTTLRKG
jgi:uncharacterized membrane protein YccF (DUF307 family)